MRADKTRDNSPEYYVSCLSLYDDQQNFLGMMINFSHYDVIPFSREIISYSLLLLFIAMFTTVIILRNIMRKQFLEPIRTLHQAIRTTMAAPLLSKFEKEKMPTSTCEEIATIQYSFYELIKNLQNASVKNIIMERQLALSHFARRVAHDLNNYLFNLNEYIKNLNISSKEHEELAHLLSDINEMTENLLTDPESNTHLTITTENEMRTTNTVYPVIQQIRKALFISEAKCSARGLKLISEIPDSLYSVFISVDAPEFRRIMINLINNAGEAEPKSKTIIVKLFQNNGQLIVNIIDDGKGIPSSILNKLGHEEITYGKKNGHGIGVYSANASVKNWGGNLNIESQENIGTTVSISVPIDSTPSWFMPILNLNGIKHIIILDDDQSIHDQWKERLKGYPVTIQNFYLPTDAISFFKTNDISKDCFFLIDYQYGTESLTGIDLIKTLSIQNQSLLCTGRSDELNIMNECEILHIKLQPKNMIDLIPINK